MNTVPYIEVPRKLELTGEVQSLPEELQVVLYDSVDPLRYRLCRLQPFSPKKNTSLRINLSNHRWPHILPVAKLV